MKMLWNPEVLTLSTLILSSAIFEIVHGGGVVGNPIARAYPCKGTEVITESFESNQPPEDENKFILGINLNKTPFGFLSASSKINLTFDSSANVTLMNDFGRINSLSDGKFLIYVHTERRGYVAMKVRGQRGRPVPNLLSIVLDRDELCPNGTTIGIWDSAIKGDALSAVSRLNAPSSDPGCGRRKVVHTELITNGVQTKPGDWPWHAAIYKVNLRPTSQRYICGGSLLNPSRVLTAGHCVTESGVVVIPERLFVVLGKYNLAGGNIESQERGVFRIIRHFEFDTKKLTNDIAILVLASEVNYGLYVQPICLWDRSKTSKSEIVNQLGSVVGWGFDENTILSQKLAQAMMPVVPDLTCIRSNVLFFDKFLNDNSYCAGFRNGTSVCNGDSGGGMFFSQVLPDGERTWYLRGLVSLSVSRDDIAVCDSSHYVIFTDVAKYLDWIGGHLE